VLVQQGSQLRLADEADLLRTVRAAGYALDDGAARLAS